MLRLSNTLQFSENLCIGFTWQRCGSRGGFCEKTPRAAPMATEPVPADSKMNLPLAKAETISDAGSASVKTYLIKGRKRCARAAEREE